jgi:predicted TIM-barrel fold metal-dependent hydrolase
LTAAPYIDIHQHLALGAGEFDLIEVPAEDAFPEWLDRAAAAMPRLPQGWTRALLPPVFFQSAGGAQDVRRLNDLMLAAAARPELSVVAAFGVVEPQQGEAAFAELDRIARQGLDGVAFSPRAQGVFADTPELVALVRHATGCGLLTLVHATPRSGNESLWRIWNLAEQCAPSPIVALGALGDWENVQAINAAESPGNLYYDTAGLADAAVAAAAKRLTLQRVLYGSGAHDAAHAARVRLSHEAIPEDLRPAVLRDNARRLLGAGGAA